MKLNFDPNQTFQLDAIEAVASLFEGHPRVSTDLSFGALSGFAAVSNGPEPDPSLLLANLHTVQAANGITVSGALQYIEQDKVRVPHGAKLVRFPNFSVEMETGTGKTYVYLRTILELFRRFAFRKFIVVVPSIAIREGVLKTLQITRDHFRDLFDNVPYRFYVYDSANLSTIRNFALSDSVEIMVMTIASFNRDANVIRQSTDRLQGETPIHIVQATRPILILDEPQNMESALSIEAISQLDPLFALRYSATHRNPYNLIYRLTPISAYLQNLVKRIEVASVTKQDDANQVFLRLDEIIPQKTYLTARIAIHSLMRTGSIKEEVITVRYGDDLEQRSNRTDYAGYTVDEINAAGDFVRFANNVEIRKGDAPVGADKDAIFAEQIRYTVEEHFRKQQRLRPHNIKVLSLFFIDRVDNYAPEDGIIRTLFNQAFNDLKPRFADWRDLDPSSVQAAYFAQRKTKAGVVFEDSTSGETAKDREAYDLIMRDKERLLSFEEPVSFIFSHSALREGWDNPNVFQICTLNQTRSDMKKRQEIGRGVRLCVNQSGDRVFDRSVNILTVVANEAYDRYVSQLQSEIEDEYGTGSAPPKPTDARKRGLATLRKSYTLKPEFQQLWERIKQKTRYSVTIDTNRLVDDVVRDLNDVDVQPPRIVTSKAGVTVGEDNRLAAVQMAGERTAADLSGRTPLPNLVDVMANLLEFTSPPMRLTRRTLLEIFKRCTNKNEALDNPHEFAAAAVRIIKAKLADQLVAGIKYEPIDNWYEMSQFQDSIESWQEYLVPADRGLYDHVIVDSDVERNFTKALENRDDPLIKFYIKLPDWFTVPTPIGNYNPDWAIVKQQTDPHGILTDTLYFICETKGSTKVDDLQYAHEKKKIACGTRHFRDALDIQYILATTVNDLP